MFFADMRHACRHVADVPTHLLEELDFLRRSQRRRPHEDARRNARQASHHRSGPTNRRAGRNRQASRWDE